MMAQVAELLSRSRVLHRADAESGTCLARVARAGTTPSHTASSGAPMTPKTKNSARQPSAAISTGDIAKPSRLPAAGVLLRTCPPPPAATPRF